MKTLLHLYAWTAPVILAPLSFYLWWRVYGNTPQVLTAWLIPVLWAWLVPAYGTNVLKVWEFNTRLKWGRFRPHHGLVFGSATATLTWLIHVGAATSLADALRFALIVCSVLGFWNWLYDIAAIRTGILRVYNQPWAENQPASAITSDYAPWFFGGFGAAYGLIIGLLEIRVERNGVPEWPETLSWLILGLAFCILVPVAGFIRHSLVLHGHPGTRPVARKEAPSCEP